MLTLIARWIGRRRGAARVRRETDAFNARRADLQRRHALYREALANIDQTAPVGVQRAAVAAARLRVYGNA